MEGTRNERLPDGAGIHSAGSRSTTDPGANSEQLEQQPERHAAPPRRRTLAHITTRRPTHAPRTVPLNMSAAQLAHLPTVLMPSAREPAAPVSEAPTGAHTVPGAPPALLIRPGDGVIAPRGAPSRTGRRSHIPMLVTALMAVVVLVSAMVMTSPLSKSAGEGFTGFGIAAGATRWVPTPTPTLRPIDQGPAPGPNPGVTVIKQEIRTIFGQYGDAAIRVADCESDFDPNQVNSISIGGSHAAGVFQILYPSTWNSTSYWKYSPFDYRANIRAAYEIFKGDGYSWRQWQCKP